MGNALNSVGKALDAKLIGGNPLESKFAAIDKGILGVKNWKTNIDKERLELKQNTAKQIREAEKQAYDNMPSSETAQSKVLEALAKYKDQMLMNERLVRNGAIPPEENLIFFENGKQTFNYLTNNIKTFDEELQLTEKRAKGYYNDDGTFVPPISGAVEAAKQKIQTQLGTLSGMDISFQETGMGNINFYQMEVDPVNNTYRPKLDADGNKMLITGTQPNMSVLALSHKANGRADRFDVNKATEKFNKSGLVNNYQIQVSQGGLNGNVITDSTLDPNIKTVLNQEVGANMSNIENVASVLSSDNGGPVQIIPFTEWDMLSDDQKNEMVEISIITEDMERKTVKVKKYAKLAPANENNMLITELDEDQIMAGQGAFRASLVDGMERKITQGKTPNSPSYRYSAGYNAQQEEADTFLLIDKAVQGDENSLIALAKSVDKIKDYKITGTGANRQITFTLSDGNTTSPIKLDGTKTGRQLGKLLAADLGFNPETYNKESTLGESEMYDATKWGKYSSYTGEVLAFPGLGGIPAVMDGDNVVMAEDYLGGNGDTDEDELSAQGNVILANMSKKGFDTKGYRFVGEDVFGKGDDYLNLVDPSGNVVASIKGKNDAKTLEWTKQVLTNIGRGVFDNFPGDGAILN